MFCEAVSFRPTAQATRIIAVQAAFQVNSTRETPKINSAVAALKLTVAALTPKINAAPAARKTEGAGRHPGKGSLHHLEGKR